MTEPREKKSPAIESRRAPRVPIKGTVRFSVAPRMQSKVQLVKKQIHGELIDINKLGVAFHSTVFLPRGTRLHGKFPLTALKETAQQGSLPFVGTVKNCVITSQTSAEGHLLYRLGIEFDRVSKRNLALIESYAKKHLP